jgi:hypothetical protein
MHIFARLCFHLADRLDVDADQFWPTSGAASLQLSAPRRMDARAEALAAWANLLDEDAPGKVVPFAPMSDIHALRGPAG